MAKRSIWTPATASRASARSRRSIPPSPFTPVGTARCDRSPRIRPTRPAWIRPGPTSTNTRAPAAEIASLMDPDIRRFHLYDPAEEVATAFERYDLLSAPVVDDRGN